MTFYFVNHLSTGWPAGSYCIFAGATAPNCPPGFELITSFAYAIPVYNAAETMEEGSFGQSFFRCHINGGCGRNIADLRINACCK